VQKNGRMANMTSVANSSQDPAPPCPRVKAKSKIQIITCNCGTQILLVPDVKGMSKAIETHLKVHKTKDISLSEKDIEKMREDFIAQIFVRISDEKIKI
jgi:hypothetical protein